MTIAFLQESRASAVRMVELLANRPENMVLVVDAARQVSACDMMIAELAASEDAMEREALGLPPEGKP